MSELPPFELGYPRSELRRQLVEAVLRGEKTSTAGLLDAYEEDGTTPEPPGTRAALLGYDDDPVAVIEVTETRVVPAEEIDEQFARDEGEGYESVEEWRVAHESFFGRSIEAQTQIVAIRFRLVERL
jgi:uncharacterized protein YhfF